MALSVGIVGLPNVGKSTLFNALTKAQNAQAANYPFCTIEPNVAIVPVPDARLDVLAGLVNPAQIVPATVRFTDIAGLVAGASRGEGLGNKFLAHIRETEVIIHVARAFADPDVVHVAGSVDPARDIDIIDTELILADAQVLEARLDRLTKQAKCSRDKDMIAKIEAGKTAHGPPHGWPFRRHRRGRGHAGHGGPVRGDSAAVRQARHLLRQHRRGRPRWGIAAGRPGAPGGRGPRRRNGHGLRPAWKRSWQASPTTKRRECLASYGLEESGLDRVTPGWPTIPWA